MRMVVMMLALGMAAQQSTSARNGVLAGQLNTPEGAAAAIRVAAMPVPEPGAPATASASTLVSIGQTDANGRYRLEQVPPGRYYIVAGQVEFPTYYPGVIALSAATPVAVTAGSASPDLNFALSRANQDGAIEITVSVSGTGAPLTGAQLTLRRQNPAVSAFAAPPETASTDTDGRATFRNLSPGQYSIQAQLDGYLGSAPAGLSFSGRLLTTNAVTNVVPGQPPQKLSMNLVRGATISGTITDQNGVPVAGLRMSATTLNAANGRRTLSPILTGQTDDRGQYRLSWIGSGEYYIVADSFPRSDVTTESAVYPGTYYPGTTDLVKAKVVVVRGSDGASGIDFSVRKADTYHVTGTVLDPPARTLANGQTDTSVAFFIYAPRDPNAPDSSLDAPLIQNRTPGRGGEFDILLPPGVWNLFPVIFMAPATRGGGTGRGGVVTGRAGIDVVDKDVNGVTIRLSASDVKGRVVMPSNPGTLPTGFSLQQIRLSLQPRESIPAPLLTTVRVSQTLGTNGEFEFHGVPPGKYNVQVSLPPTLYIADMRLGRTSIFTDGVLTVGSGPIAPMEIVLGSGAVAVSGSVAGFTSETTIGALASTRVVLAPAPPRRQNVLLYRTTNVTALSGTFYFSGVAPGDYKIYALQGLPVGAEQDPDVLSRYETRGRAISAAAGQSLRDVQVEWIPNAK